MTRPLGQFAGAPQEVCLALKSPSTIFGSGIDLSKLLRESRSTSA